MDDDIGMRQPRAAALQSALAINKQLAGRVPSKKSSNERQLADAREKKRQRREEKSEMQVNSKASPSSAASSSTLPPPAAVAAVATPRSNGRFTRRSTTSTAPASSAAAIAAASSTAAIAASSDNDDAEEQEEEEAEAEEEEQEEEKEEEEEEEEAEETNNSKSKSKVSFASTSSNRKRGSQPPSVRAHASVLKKSSASEEADMTAAASLDSPSLFSPSPPPPLSSSAAATSSNSRSAAAAAASSSTAAAAAAPAATVPISHTPLAPRYKCMNRIREGHGNPIYFVVFNTIDARHSDIFGTAGSNRITLYRTLRSGAVDPIQLYVDEDPSEVFYTLAFGIDLRTGGSILLAAGENAVIKVIDLHSRRVVRRIVGHGGAINELKLHPLDPNLLLSTSKDMSIRIWNIQSGICIAILAGDGAHRDEVLSADWHSDGSAIVSAGMDHQIMFWVISDAIKESMKASYMPSYLHSITRSIAEPFPTVLVQTPQESSNQVHENYVDHVKFLGDFVLSKSTDEKIVMWTMRKQGKKKVRRQRQTMTTATSIQTASRVAVRMICRLVQRATLLKQVV